MRTGDTSTGSVGGKVMGAMSINYVQNTKKVVTIIDFNKCTVYMLALHFVLCFVSEFSFCFSVV